MEKLMSVLRFIRDLFTSNEEDRELMEWARGLSTEERKELISELKEQLIDDFRNWWRR